MFLCYSLKAYRHSSISWHFCRSRLGCTSSGTSCSGSATCGACTPTREGFYAPRIAVLCPCKGMEPGLEPNLVALTEFDRQNYEIFFILASASEPAVSIVKRVATNTRVKAHVLIAGEPAGCGQKVNNLCAAIEQFPEEFEVLVFTDSDGRHVLSLPAHP